MDGANPVTGQQDSPTVPSAPGDAWPSTFTPPAEPPVRPSRAPRDRIWFRQTVLRLLRDPLSRGFWRQCEYAALGLLLAIPGFVFIVVAVTVGFGMSLSFAGMLVGLPVLMVSLLGTRRLGAVHRRLAGRLLGVRVGAPPAWRPQPGALGRARAVLTDPVGWRACAYLLLKLPLAALAATIMTYLLIWGLPYLTFPIWWEILHVNGVVIHVPGWLMWWKPNPVLVANSVHSLAVSFALVPAGVAVLLYCPWWLRQCNAVDGRLVARLLGPPLGHRVRELEQTRARAVDDSAARLRRIERDLHDGAQAQMVAVAMKLGLAREKLGGTATGTAQADVARALELVDAAHRGAKDAIIELRDLARAQRRARRAGHRRARAPVGRDRDHRVLLRGRAAHQRGQAQRRPACHAGGGARGRAAAGAGQRRRCWRRPHRGPRRPGRARRAGQDRGRQAAGQQPAPRPDHGHR